MSETAAFLGPEREWSGTRLELWEVDGLGTPGLLNAVAGADGRVDVQRVEWQIEHRYRFEVEPAEYAATLREVIAADVLSVVAGPADHEAAERRQSVRIVLVNSQGSERAVTIANSRSGPAFSRSRHALRALVDPERRGVRPLWSRGPAGFLPFP